MRSIKRIFFFSIVAMIAIGFSSCRTPEGCAAAEGYRAHADLSDPDVKRKKGDSNLWSKKQRKKMKKRGQ